MNTHEGIYTELKQIFQGVRRIVVGVASHVWEDHKRGLFAVAGVATTIYAYGVIQGRKKREKWNSAGKDVVVVHGFRRGKTCANISPFGLKLETFLRMSKIKYTFDTEDPMGPKKLSPWITFNGKEIGDSQLIMEFLAEKFNKDHSAHLSTEEKASSRALAIMVDEHLFTIGDWWIWKDPDNQAMELAPYSKLEVKIMMFSFMKHIKQTFWWNGLGRHTDAEYVEMMRKDLKALSLYLGEEKFMMGDVACEVDCSVFGTLAMAYWSLPGSPFEKMLKGGEFKNLVDYIHRMKETFWPDWDNLLTK